MGMCSAFRQHGDRPTGTMQNCCALACIWAGRQISRTAVVVHVGYPTGETL